MLDLELPSILYEYWDTLPAVLEVEAAIAKKLQKKPIRNEILHAFSRGILDETPTRSRRRHALSVVEIVDLVKSFSKEKPKKSSIYYHLELLMEFGIIQELTSVKAGNIVTMYFGRTSKLIFLQSEAEEIHKKSEGTELVLQPGFQELVSRVSAKDQTEISNLTTEIARIKSEINLPDVDFVAWVKEHSDDLVGIDLNLVELHNLFVNILKYPPELVELYQKLKEYLKLE